MPIHLRFPTRILLLALLLGIAADRVFVGRWIGLSAPVFVGVGLLALGYIATVERRLPTRGNLWLGFGALLFAGVLAVRDTPLLVALNSVAVCGLLVLLVANFRGAALHRTSAAQALIGGITTGIMIIATPFSLLGRSLQALPIRRARLGAAAPLARGIALAIPAVFVFGGLLMAADSVFASYVLQTISFSFPLDWESLIGHGLIIGFVAWGCAGGIATALSADAAGALPAEGDTQRLANQYAAWRLLGWVESVTVLVAVDLLFGTFMLVQGAYFFGGSDTLARTQMTYADYARRGFFELVVVACLSLALLWLLAIIGKREPGRQRRVFDAASMTMVVLVLGMLASAFQRMWLYEQAYGFTQLRLYTHSFMIWLAVILLLFVVALVRDSPRTFTWGSLLSSLAYLAALNFANPDALIVRANVGRFAQTGSLDTYYLATLSADATPELAAALGTVDQESRDAILSALKEQRFVLQEATEQGWAAWSFARWQALRALDAMP